MSGKHAALTVNEGLRRSVFLVSAASNDFAVTRLRSLDPPGETMHKTHLNKGCCPFWAAARIPRASSISPIFARIQCFSVSSNLC
jgi:hypothetical protein